jgi:hypothetical protein
MTDEPPRGLKAIIALCGTTAVVALIVAILIGTGRAPLAAGAFLLGGGLEQRGPVAFLLYALLLLVLALALWKRWRWARRAAILAAVVGVGLSVPAMSSAVMDSRISAIAREGAQIVVRVMVVFYLGQEPVKDWFAGQ